MVFRVCDNAPELLRKVFEERGWKEYQEGWDEDWNIWWKSSGFRGCDFDKCKPWQRLNHFPKSGQITRKDSLARNLRRMRGVYGSFIYNFSPLSFILPNDYKKFVGEYSKQENCEEKSFWICKPVDLSRGRGIFIFKDLNELTYDCATVVQKYIANPFLVSGYKLDLRLYVLVTSFNPLLIYIYHEGLVRFGTEKFDLGQPGNIFSHLTNTSINKFSPSYSCKKERVGSGCKWTLSQLRTYFHQNQINDSLLWHKVNAIIVLTLLTQAAEISEDVPNCFELFGFDVLIDENLKPWLLEVNFSPSLIYDCPLDATIKKPMLNDIINLLSFRKVDACKVAGSHSGIRKKAPTQLKCRERSRAFQREKSNLEKSNNEGGDNDSNPPESEAESDSETYMDSSSSVLDSTGINKSIGKLGINERMTKNIQDKLLYSGDNTGEVENDNNLEKEYAFDFPNVERPKTTQHTQTVLHHNECRYGKASMLSQSTTKYSRRSKTERAQTSKISSGHITRGGQTRFVRKKQKIKSSIARVTEDSKQEVYTTDKILPNSKNSDSPNESMRISARSYANAVSANNRFIKKPIAQSGNYILAFPFNDATAKSSSGLIDTKTCVDEIKKALNKISRAKNTMSDDSSTLNLSQPFWGFKPSYNFGI